MSKNDSPCKGCTDRFIGCHASCTKYIDWKQAREVFLQNVREQRDLRDALYANSIERAEYTKQNGGVKHGRKSNDSRYS